MSTWGSEVMMLGAVPVGRSTSELGAIQPPTPPTDWAFLIGSYTGAWVGGASVGFVVGKRAMDAVTGGMAASGIWGITETITSARDRNPWLSLVFLGLGAGSLYFAWRRKR